MLLLQKAHIGEVQSSIWDKHTIEECESKGVVLL
jgi:aspartate--ammonia ligase